MSELLFQSSIDEIISQRAIPPEMLRDLHNIAGLSEATCVRIAGAVHALEGLTTSDAVEATVRDAIGDDSPAASSVCSALTKLRDDGVERLVASVTEWVNANNARKEVFSDRTLEQLSRNLRVLITDNRAVRLLQKADKLLRDVGNEIHDIKFVCDLRPVFDSKKEKVDAFVLVANFRLIYMSQDGQRQSCEIALTEDELETLHKKTVEAKEKMKVLNTVRSTVSITLPGNEGAE